jgi:hypothetical protein
MAEVLVPVLSKLPELRFVVFGSSEKKGSAAKFKYLWDMTIRCDIPTTATWCFQKNYLSESTGPDFIQPM